jgi:putative transposase
MKIIRGFKTELDLNDRQRTACLKHAGAARFAYNFALQRKEEARRAGKKIPTAMELHRELNERKKGDLAWLYEVSKCAPQEALRDADRAFDNHYRRVQARKAGTLKGKVGYPRFKSRKRRIGSFRLTGTIRVFERHIQLPRLGRLRLHERDYLPLISTSQRSEDAHMRAELRSALVLSATVSEHAGRWYVSVQVEMEVPDPAPATGPVIGVDLGIRTLATCSDGRIFANPRALEHTQKSLRRAQRTLARRKKGSKNREKARRKVARLHARVANLRRDALHQATARIVARTKPASERPAVVVLEDLNVAGMVKNRRLARAISDVGMSEFRRQVMYKAAWAGVRVLIAPRFFPSSKRCSVCHHHKDTLRLSEETYVCEACGTVMDRDLNAACNLEQLVLSSA